jgi:hypothetical protein
VAEQRAFEQDLLRRKPQLDPMSLRVAWQMQRTTQLDQDTQRGAALGRLDPEVMEIGR